MKMHFPIGKKYYKRGGHVGNRFILYMFRVKE